MYCLLLGIYTVSSSVYTLSPPRVTAPRYSRRSLYDERARRNYLSVQSSMRLRQACVAEIRHIRLLNIFSVHKCICIQISLLISISGCCDFWEKPAAPIWVPGTAKHWLVPGCPCLKSSSRKTVQSPLKVCNQPIDCS